MKRFLIIIALVFLIVSASLSVLTYTCFAVEFDASDAYTLIATIRNDFFMLADYTGYLESKKTEYLKDPEILIVDEESGDICIRFSEWGAFLGLLPDYRYRYETFSDFKNHLKTICDNDTAEWLFSEGLKFKNNKSGTVVPLLFTDAAGKEWIRAHYPYGYSNLPLLCIDDLAINENTAESFVYLSSEVLGYLKVPVRFVREDGEWKLSKCEYIDLLTASNVKTVDLSKYVTDKVPESPSTGDFLPRLAVSAVIASFVCTVICASAAVREKKSAEL